MSRVIGGLAAQGLELIDGEALREHYARTLWHWVDRLESNADTARAEVGEEKFRVWRIYMAGSAHAFDRGWMSLWQLLAGKPLADGRLPHPLTRDYMRSLGLVFYAIGLYFLVPSAFGIAYLAAHAHAARLAGDCLSTHLEECHRWNGCCSNH